jgi:hypothetical protein
MPRSRIRQGDCAQAINVPALINRDIALHELNRLAPALTGFDEATGLRPNTAEAFYCRGNRRSG